MTAGRHAPERAATTFAVVLVLGLVAGSQSRGPTARAPADDGQARAERGVIESMSHRHPMTSNPHLRLTARRPERPGDRKRAEGIVAALRPALERYRDYRVAVNNGYEIFRPDIPQPIYHFINYLQGFADTFRFKPDVATSLLYRQIGNGYELVGAMYTAPRDSQEVELDIRVPLSFAQWHQHVNICLPPQGTAATADWKTFGPEGSIATPEACAAAHGRFVPQLFGWMVHVYPFEKTLEKIWATE